MDIRTQHLDYHQGRHNQLCHTVNRLVDMVFIPGNDTIPPPLRLTETIENKVDGMVLYRVITY